MRSGQPLAEGFWKDGYLKSMGITVDAVEAWLKHGSRNICGFALLVDSRCSTTHQLQTLTSPTRPVDQASNEVNIHFLLGLVGLVCCHVLGLCWDLSGCCFTFNFATHGPEPKKSC